jgi:hypothetical protein
MDDPNFDKLPDEMKLEVIYNLDVDSALSFCRLKEYSRFCYSYRLAEYFLQKYYPHLGVFGDPFTHLNGIYNDQSDCNITYSILNNIYRIPLLGNCPPPNTSFLIVDLVVAILGTYEMRHKPLYIVDGNDEEKVNEWLNEMIDQSVNDVLSMLDGNPGSLVVERYDIVRAQGVGQWSLSGLTTEQYTARREVLEEVIITAMFETDVDQYIWIDYNDALRFMFHVVEYTI